MQNLPLENVKVIELCNVAAGPYCGMLLADMGADVIKVERPEGDSLRSWPPITNDFSENFASLNRNKRSIILDLKNPEDIEHAKNLIKDADVLIENNRPGVMKRLGLDYEGLSKLNPKLIYCSISAYGQTGPRSKEGGFDLTIQAMAGVMSVTGESDGAPVKCGVPLADFAAGLYAAFSISAALRSTQETGKGVHIDVPMLGTTLAIAALQTSEYFGSNKDPIKLGSAHPRNAPYQAFQCKGGYFAMAAGNDVLWRNVCNVINRLDLAENPLFLSTTLRAKNQKQLLVILENIFSAHDADYWLNAFREVGVPVAPINSYSEALADPQVEHMQWVQPITLPGGTDTKTFISPIRLNGQNLPIRLAPPSLGEHNDELLGQKK